ncbi:MAG: hypothetical protein O3A80_04520 [bacterium]|nr:hypothetical protein [bacterium]
MTTDRQHGQPGAGDLVKSSPEYKAHATQIERLLTRMNASRNQIQQALNFGAKRVAAIPIHSGGMPPDRNLPRLNSVNRDEHINCAAVKGLHHNVSMEVFHRDHNEDEIADLRLLLREIASVRLSILNFKMTGECVDHVTTIEDTDRLLRESDSEEDGVPSLVPHLFTANSAISELKKKLGGNKFRDPALMLNMGDMFVGDTHILHSVCMSLVTNEMPEHVQEVLQNRADMDKELAPLRGHAIVGLFQMNPDLFVVHIIGLVESGKTEEAISWCHRGHFKPMLQTNINLALKYVVALRNQKQFVQAMRFCEEARDVPALQDRKFAAEYKMALAGYDGILPLSLDEFKERYPNV